MDSKRHTDSGFTLGEAINDAYYLTATERALFRLADQSTHSDFSQEDAVAFSEAGQELAKQITELHQQVSDL